MAEPYQLPGQFQVPSMAEVSYAAGEQQPGADANWKMFTEQINAYTNINNANRLQSYREKQFLQQIAQDQRDFDRRIVENDRQFDLNKLQQEAAARNSNIQYELNRFNFDKAREQYEQLQETYANYPKIRQEISALLPNGGKTFDWQERRAEIRAQFAKNPSQAAIVDQILSDYDAQYKMFTDDSVIKDQGKVLRWIRGNTYNREVFDDAGNVIGYEPITFNGKTAQEAYDEARKAYLNNDLVTYEAIMEPLRQLGQRKDRLRETTEVIQENVGISRSTGVPISQIKRTPAGDIETTFQPPRVYGARGTGGETGVKTFSEGDVKLLQDSVQQVDVKIGMLNEKLDREDNPLRKAGLEAEKAGLEAQKQRYLDIIEMGTTLIQQKAQQQLPQTNQPTQAPAQPAGRPRPQNILRPPSMPAPAATPVSGNIIQPRGVTVTPSGIQFQAPVSAGTPVRSAGMARSVSG